MSIYWCIDFTGLLTADIQKDCENEFQTQMNKTEGEIFTWANSHFGRIDLNHPGPASQAVLQYFANCGCPISGVLLALSLYPYTPDIWPVRSEDMSFKYLFHSIEIILNIRTDKRINQLIYQFEQSIKFKQAMHIATIFIGERCISANICPEVMMYVRKVHAEPMVLQ